jgi:methylenetetrahydrofolate reductase (NADPH)
MSRPIPLDFLPVLLYHESMKISELYSPGKTVVSFEIFPPKKESGAETVYETLHSLGALQPDFISVTYGAGGSSREGNITAQISQYIKSECKTESLAHLTCAEMTAADIDFIAADLKGRGIGNVLALKGDAAAAGGFRYAKDLLAALKKYGFCLGAAAYPEGHISCESLADDMDYLKQKQDSGADFLVTQLFFSNDIFYRFFEKARAKGITLPVSAGVMPILSKPQLQRMIFMCGASLPSPIIKLVNKYGAEGESLVRAGVEYSCRQMQDLCDGGAEGIHIYTMNKPFIADYCLRNLRVNRV